MPPTPPTESVSERLVLHIPSDGVDVSAWRDALRVELIRTAFEDFDGMKTLSSSSTSILGKALDVLVPQILELGRGRLEGANCLAIEYDDIYALEEDGTRVFEELAPWAPFVVELSSSGSLGASSFRYQYRLYFGTQQIFPKRFGAFVSQDGRTYRLDRSTFSLLRAIDEVNSLPDEERVSSRGLIRFAGIKGLAEDVGVQLDSYLMKERVVIPPEIGLAIDEDDKGLSFVPTVIGVPEDALKRTFLAFDDAQNVYSVDHPEGGRIRVILGERQKDAVHRMRKVRFLKGADRARALSNPASLFDGIVDVVNLEGLGPRVRGIGNFPFVSKPYITTTGVFDEELGVSGELRVGIECRYNDGTKERIEFGSIDECKRFLYEVKRAVENGDNTVDLKGRTLVLDPDFLKGIDHLENRLFPKEKVPPVPKEDRGQYLLIETNEEDLGFRQDEPEEEVSGPQKLELPRALRDPDCLKRHQKVGIAWLERNYNLRSRGRRGCLLADDMGLGKTLQILNFIAWVIEKGGLSAREDRNSDFPPWNPVLVVAPVMLLEDRTWIRDMERFFEYEGSVFQPCLVLHGEEIRALRVDDAPGRETAIGRPVLDLDQIRKNRLVLTNYETVVNYQHSLARINWSAVVTDEAQEYKTPSTKISHALKSLDPVFRIACTGTPVETRLIDVWNIFDFLQPGSLLGSAKDFTNEFEKSLEQSEQGRSETLSRLKEKLRHGQLDSFILRREKTELSDLPQKYEHDLPCDLSPSQRELHLDLVSRFRSIGEPTHHLSLIHNLMFLYQHPELISIRDGILQRTTQEIVGCCPKLWIVLQTLEKIQERGEKALVFTRSLLMQQVLAKVIGETLGLRVDIVNGGTKRAVSTRSASETRKGIITRFQRKEGFNVIVLSPDVAGFGLTLVEANHVIHYGRWWNPAKESQATDRVYRIGQEKDVHVYYPIAHDPAGEFKTFDEKLNDLLKRRRELATDFLMPMPGEEDIGRELFEEILEGEPAQTHRGKRLTLDDVCLLPWDRFECLIALLETKLGHKTILTPQSGDEGVDVLSCGTGEIRLIQCKHTTFGRDIDGEAIGELIEAFDGYRARYFSGKRIALGVTLSTTGKFTDRAKVLARDAGVKLVSGQELGRLLIEYPVSLAEIEETEGGRCKTMRDVRYEICKW